MPRDDKQVENFAFGHRGNQATLHIALVNNMPDSDLRATELQFARLLKEASGNFDVRLHLFAMAEVPRGEVARSRMEGFYGDAADLPGLGLDALIITGAEPHDEGPEEEPYWHGLTRLMDWAESGTVSTLFSGQAAHAAVLHFDGVVRRPLPKKLSGVFDSVRTADDLLLTGIPPRAATPHLRQNGLLESDLTGHGYRVLTRLTDGSVDLFVRDGRSRFVFLQGHPEYGAEALGREYLHDMGRHLDGKAPRPSIPENYFDRVTENTLQALTVRQAPIGDYNDVVMAAVPLQSWRSHTLRLFANWIAGIAADKPRRRANRPAAAQHKSP
jgi:homoserine O-succinyltransferase